MKSLLKFIRNSFVVIIVIFVIVGIILGIKSYNDTWTIDKGHFKAVYDDYDDCILNNLGTGTTEQCDDKNQVKYINEK